MHMLPFSSNRGCVEKNKLRMWILFALVVLLTIQLTGVNCPSDFALTPESAVLLVQDEASYHLNGFASGANDGCPCHLTFQTVSLFPFSVLSPFTSMLPETPQLFVATLLYFLFHPPALV